MRRKLFRNHLNLKLTVILLLRNQISPSLLVSAASRSIWTTYCLFATVEATSLGQSWPRWPWWETGEKSCDIYQATHNQLWSQKQDLSLWTHNYVSLLWSVCLSRDKALLSIIQLFITRFEIRNIGSATVIDGMVPFLKIRIASCSRQGTRHRVWQSCVVSGLHQREFYPGNHVQPHTEKQHSSASTASENSSSFSARSPPYIAPSYLK
jgi:hypothetical protein